MYVITQINLIDGSFKPIGVIAGKSLAEETIKELNKDKKYYCVLSEDLPVVIKKID